MGWGFFGRNFYYNFCSQKNSQKPPQPLFSLLFPGFSTATFRGKEFLAAFPQNNDEGIYPDLQLIFTAHVASTQVTVTAHGDTFTQTVTLGKAETVSVRVPGRMEMVGTRISNKVVSVQSTEEISVVSVNAKKHTVGATAVLPVENLGHRYYLVTPEDANVDGVKEFVVVAGKTSARVSINVKGRFYYNERNYSPGSTLRIFLHPYHSFQLQSSYDLSGTKITSDNAVAVLSGHSCAKVHTACDYVVEQLLPVTAWGNVYVIPPNPLQKDMDFVYVVAAEKASITYNTGTSATTKDIAAGEVHKFNVNQNLFFYVSASAPIQVVFFFTGAHTGLIGQDPFLLNIPPVSTYCTSYRVSSLDDYENHVVLIAHNADANAVTLNQKTDSTVSWQTIPGTDFSWATVTMNEPGEIQSAEHRWAPFGLLVFGFQNYAGYGFTGLCAASK